MSEPLKLSDLGSHEFLLASRNDGKTTISLYADFGLSPPFTPYGFYIRGTNGSGHTTDPNQAIAAFNAQVLIDAQQGKEK
jgi:hypothetical protein